MRRIAGVLVLALLAAACGLFDKNNDSPTSPSGPQDPNAPVFYTALGASDAVGVGASVVCVPLTSCDNGTGYVPVIARRLRATRQVTLVNIGIPGAVLSPSIHDIARRVGRDIPANFVEREMPFVPSNSTLVTIFGGGNDVNALGDAIERGAAGSDVNGYIETQVRAFGNDFDRLVRGVRERAPNATIIVLNLPNFALLPYASGYSAARRQAMQAISAGFSREANDQRTNGAIVVDLMCDARTYDASRFSNDGFHPNDSGYAALADKVLAAFEGDRTPPPSSCAEMSAL